VYVHLPLCRALCHYCACNVIVSTKPGAAAGYLDLLAAELELVARALAAPQPPPVTQLHLGGGTPTYLTPDELAHLHELLGAALDLSALEERAVEVDPRATTGAHLEALADLGFDRLSVGVQDFDPSVQEAINRRQSVAGTEGLVRAARELGFRGVNVDLIYGLPREAVGSFRRTLAEVVRIRPDRVALYSFAHVPWLRPAQRRFDEPGYDLPGPAEKLELFRAAVEAFEAAGYASPSARSAATAAAAVSSGVRPAPASTSRTGSSAPGSSQRAARAA